MAIYNGDDWMIARTDNFDGVEVGPFPDLTGWSKKYHFTSGYCFAAFRDMGDEEQAQRLLNEGTNLIFHGVPAELVLQEFAKIWVWCEMRVRLISGSYMPFLPEKGFEKWNPWSGE